VSAEGARGWQSPGWIAPLGLHKHRLKHEPVCLVALDTANSAASAMRFRRLRLTVLLNAVIIGT
jgi:hypothetical protein